MKKVSKWREELEVIEERGGSKESDVSEVCGVSGWWEWK